MTYVTFEYTDGRLPAGRTITMAPAKAHEVASAHPVRIVDGWDEYAAFCEAHGHELAAAEAESASDAEQAAGPEEAAEAPEAGGDSSTDGWPAGYSHERKGAWYSVFDPEGRPIGKAKGENAAQELAWTHQNAESVPPAEDG